ncbi:MAG: hypothetical protein R2726_15030 [Acidimicrobiales bacterium]
MTTTTPDAPRSARPGAGRPRSWARLLAGSATAGLLVLGLAACSKSNADTAGGDVASLSGDATATTAPADQKSTEEKVLAFSKCMRDNGVPNFPDPKVDAQGRIDPGGFRDNAQNGGFDPQSQSFRDAMDACRSNLQGINLGRGNVDQSKFRDAAVQYAQCMRDQGVANVTDPTFPTPGQGGGGFGGGQGQSGQGAPGGQSQAGQGQSGQGQGQGGQGQGGPGGGRGGNGLLRAMGLDPNDPAVQAADKTCRPAFQQAVGQAGPQQ